MDAGDGSLFSFISDVKLNIADKTMVLDTIAGVNKQMMNISKISLCSKVSKECIYVTHNDIKPENAIFKRIGRSYTMEFIDYGGLLFSTSFFTPINVHTRLFMTVVYGNNRRSLGFSMSPVASPLYDIGCVIYSMLVMIYNDYYTPNTDLETLKELYVGSDLAPINVKYTELQATLYEKVKIAIYEPIIIADVPESIQSAIKTYVKKLLHYINLLMCINRFMFINSYEISAAEKNRYKNLDFNGFKLMDVKNDGDTITVLGYKTFDGLRNLELLDRVVAEVERNVAMT